MEEEKNSGALLLGWISQLREGILALDATVTQFKALDSYLREFQAIINTFAEKTGQGIVLVQDDRYIWANRTACDIFGYSLDEVLELSPEDTTLPTLRDKYGARVKMLLAGDYLDEADEWPVLRKDRTIKYVSAFGYRVTFMLKPALMVFFYDITESKNVQAQLELRAELLDLVSDAILLMEPSGKIVYANEASCDLTGYTREELLGMSVQNLGAPEFMHRLNIRIKQFSEHKESRYRALSLRKDGAKIPIEIRGKVVKQGGRPYLLGVAREIVSECVPGNGVPVRRETVMIKWKTRVTDLLGCKYPILQGAIARLGDWRFAAAVAEAGAHGTITASISKTPQQLREDIKQCRKATSGSFGVNLSIGICPQIDEMLDVCIEERVAVETSVYKPDALAPRIKQAGLKWIHKAARVKDAVHAQELGPDAIILVGLEGAGIKNPEQLPTMTTILWGRKNISLPLIAAGGIGDANGFLGALALGADGVMMGSVFMVTQECQISAKDKQQIIQLSPDNPELRKYVMGGIQDKGPAASNPDEIDWARVVSFGVTGMKKVPTVKELIEGIVTDAEAIIGRWEFLKSA